MALYINQLLNPKINKNEVGSSAMPHKVNPIDFENAEDLMLANSQLSLQKNFRYQGYKET